MIQFNLLPDVKLEYIKAERTKHLFISVSTLASIVAVGILVLLLLTVDGLQKKNIHDLNVDIKTTANQVQTTPDLNQILTVQNQLSSLTNLHDQKPAAPRLFTFLSQVTPSNVTISNVETDFTQHTLIISGNAGSIDNVNTFVDTLKFTTYTTDKNSTPAKAFSDVVLASFSRNTNSASYTINLTFDQTIFDNASSVTLSVPNTVTTRSVTDQPGALFKTTTESK